MRAVMDELSRWQKPALVAFSDSDPVFPYPRAGQVFCDQIPGAGEQVRIEGAAHFLQRTEARRSPRPFCASVRFDAHVVHVDPDEQRAR